MPSDPAARTPPQCRRSRSRSHPPLRRSHQPFETRRSVWDKTGSWQRAKVQQPRGLTLSHNHPAQSHLQRCGDHRPHAVARRPHCTRTTSVCSPVERNRIWPRSPWPESLPLIRSASTSRSSLPLFNVTAASVGAPFGHASGAATGGGTSLGAAARAAPLQSGRQDTTAVAVAHLRGSVIRPCSVASSWILGGDQPRRGHYFTSPLLVEVRHVSAGASAIVIHARQACRCRCAFEIGGQRRAGFMTTPAPPCFFRVREGAPV